MSTIRFGVIGLRRGQSFVRICRAVGGATVTALYDIDAARVAKAAGELGARAFTDYDQFLAAEIDAVIIASPLPYHAQQAITALAAGKHVLSEVTAADNFDDARALVAAARASSAVYMMAENYRYLDEVELLKRLHDAGRFGALYYGEGEYLHDCRGLWYNEDGSLTWRGQGRLSVYCTHSLGPLLYITGDRVASVSSLAAQGGLFDPQVTYPTMHLMQLATTSGAVLRVRVDHVSPRPHQMAYYALQGTAGSYEAWRGNGDSSKVWLADEHEPSLFHAPAQWHALGDQAERYIPDRLAAPPEARSGGHGTSEYWLLRDFLAAARGEAPVPIDVYRGLDYTLPGICAVTSAAQGGAPIAVPDPREW
jgi:predicted dehydrogenase